MYWTSWIRKAICASAVVALGVSFAAGASVANADGYGVACLFTNHVYTGPTGESVYVDPGDGYDESNGWTVKYKVFNSLTQEWSEDWTPIDTFGDVDAKYCCDEESSCYESGDVYTWAFQTGPHPSYFTAARWAVFIEEDFPGTGCTSQSDRDVWMEIDTVEDSSFGDGTCTDGDISIFDAFITVYHD